MPKNTLMNMKCMVASEAVICKRTPYISLPLLTQRKRQETGLARNIKTELLSGKFKQ